MDVKDPFVEKLQIIIRFAVRILAFLMVLVILLGVIDVGWTLYQKLINPPAFILTIPEILATFGAFMAVLIAIEIFVNITIYLRDDVIHVKIVIATALMAVARKVIILDMEKTEPLELIGLALLVVTCSIAYWLVHEMPTFSIRFGKNGQKEPVSNGESEHQT